MTQEGIAISVVTYMEAFQVTEREADPEASQAGLDIFLEAAPVIALSPEVASRCARLRESLRRDKKRVRARPLDLLVATTVLEYDLTLEVSQATPSALNKLERRGTPPWTPGRGAWPPAPPYSGGVLKPPWR